MEKTKSPITLQLTATQVELAARMGISPVQYAQHLMNMTAKDAAVDDNKDEDGDGNPNNNEILNAPIATLKNMWLVKFGYRWIEDEDPAMDNTWDDIRERLDNYGLLEERNYWYKLKEDL